MIKRTLFITTPHFLSLKNSQMVLASKETGEEKTVPIEDIGFVVVEHSQCLMTMPLMSYLSAHNVAVIFCDSKKMPCSSVVSLSGNQIQNEVYRAQLSSTPVLNKQIWKSTVCAKVKNQAKLLENLGRPNKDLLYLIKQVKSGDTTNIEGQAARLFWSRLFGSPFKRDRDAEDINSLFNYGYIVLRAAVARALVGSGLMLTLGVHHHNRYNAFCLADDVMEPYRPYVDKLVYDMTLDYGMQIPLDKYTKAAILKVLTSDVSIGAMTRPLMLALCQTSASLVKSYQEKNNVIIYPDF